MLENYEGAWSHEYYMARAEAYTMYLFVTLDGSRKPRAPFTSESAAVTAGRMDGLRERRADEKLRAAYGTWGKYRKRVWQGRYLAAFERLMGSGALNKNTGIVSTANSQPDDGDLTPSDEKAVLILEAMQECGLWPPEGMSARRQAELRWGLE